VQRPLRFRRFLAIAPVAGLLMWAGPIPPPARAQSENSIVVATNGGAPNMAVFYGVAHDLFKKAGLHVTLQIVTNGAAAQLAVVGGAAQIAVTNMMSMTEAIGKGVPIEAVAPGSEYSARHPDVLALVLPDSPITTLKDLLGRTVATADVGDESSTALMALLDRHGLDPNEVHFVEVPPPLMYAALEAHRVDAILPYDPFASADAAKGLRTVALPNNGIAHKFLAVCYVARKSWVRSHRAEAAAFAQVIHDVSLYATAHYDELIPFIAHFSHQPVATLEHMQPEVYPGGVYPNMVQPVIDVAAKFRHFKPYPASRAIFDIPLNVAAQSTSVQR
jgi:NitT/TauT family transport system substrate-binding protein